MSSSTTSNPQDGHEEEEEVDELIDDDAPDTTRHDLKSTALAPTSSKPTRPNAHRLIQMSVEVSIAHTSSLHLTAHPQCSLLTWATATVR